MKITLLQENLRNALNNVSKAVPTKPPLAILSSILLQAQPTNLQLSGTDLYLGIQAQVLGNTEEPGEIAVPGKILSEIISALPPGKVTLSTQENTLTITSTSGRTQIQGQSSDDFPPFPTPNGQTFFLSGAELQTIDTNLRFSTGLDPTRVVLTSLLFQFSQAGLKVVATDGFRLAIQVFPDHISDQDTTLLVPAKALSEVNRIAQAEKVETLTFSVSQELKQLSFSINDTQIFVRLIEGDFPPYQKIVPASFELEAEWDGEEFLSQLKRAMIFARESSHIIRLSLTEQTLTIKASSTAQGEYEGSIPVSLSKGTGNVIAFNAKYLIDFISTLKPAKVWFGMNESLKPAMFRPSGSPTYSYVVMPFRVNE